MDDLHEKSWSYYRQLGQCHCVLISRTGKPLLVIGPDCKINIGSYFLFLFIIIAGVGGLFAVSVASKISIWLEIIGLIIVGFTLITYLITAVKDPGLGAIGDIEIPLLGEPYCYSCRSYQPITAIHCGACGVCVMQRDHHCPWVGKCVGEGNWVFFNCFLSGLVGTVFYILACSVLMETKSGKSN